MERVFYLNFVSGGFLFLQSPAIVTWSAFISGPEFDEVFGIEEFRISCCVFSLLGIVLSCFLQYQANIGMKPSRVKSLFKVYLVGVLTFLSIGIILIVLFDVFLFLSAVFGLTLITDKDLMIVMDMFFYIWVCGLGSITSIFTLPVWFLSY